MELSVQSFEGLLVILLLAFIVYSVSKKMLKFAAFAISLLLIMQIGYMFSLTNLNHYIPFSMIFQYDIVTSAVHFLGNNIITDVLLQITTWFQEALINGINTLLPHAIDTLEYIEPNTI